MTNSLYLCVRWRFDEFVISVRLCVSDAPTTPPSNYVAVALVEGEELHSKMVGAEDAGNREPDQW